MFYSSSIMSSISSSVSRMPSRASWPTDSMVFSTSFLSIPSPPCSALPFSYRSKPRSPASTAEAIFVAHEGFAPQRTVADIMPRVLVIVGETAAPLQSPRQATPDAAPQPADTAPQKALSLPMGVF